MAHHSPAAPVTTCSLSPGNRAVIESQVAADQDRHPLRDHRLVLDILRLTVLAQEEDQLHDGATYARDTDTARRKTAGRSRTQAE